MCGGGGVLKYEIGIFLPHCLKMGGLRSGLSLKMRSVGGGGGGCFQSGPSQEKQGIWKLKITKKRIFFLKRQSFRSAQVGKAEQRMIYFKTKVVFWSGLRRNSRVAKSLCGAFTRHIPVLSLYGSTPPLPRSWIL